MLQRVSKLRRQGLQLQMLVRLLHDRQRFCAHHVFRLPACHFALALVLLVFYGGVDFSHTLVTATLFPFVLFYYY